ncbi:hypothetical protein GCM10010383_78810 [Streptomyces lomondensis]|uniref:Uncharacterized protein n=1 Tax=Streptomyces lomondensis TaxID=68229 RepID=A0ABQ2XW54_9ACTN|nr:hypothetical protein GCM10010383_78810 [Streptomyces lomondensis]
MRARTVLRPKIDTSVTKHPASSHTSQIPARDGTRRILPAQPPSDGVLPEVPLRRGNCGKCGPARLACCSMNSADADKPRRLASGNPVILALRRPSAEEAGPRKGVARPEKEYRL